MTRLVRILAVALVAAALSACGDDAPAKGSTLDLKGEVQGNNGNGGGSSLNVTDPNIGLIWSVSDPAGSAPVAVTQVTPLASAQLPVQFAANITAAPPAGVTMDLYDANGNVDGSIGFANIIALDDVDSDGAFEVTDTGLASPDLIFGISWKNAVLYVDTLPTADTAAMYFANPENLVAGYQVVEFDYCSGQMKVLPSGTSVEIDTFDPTADVTEDLYPADLFEDCGGEETPPSDPCSDELDACYTTTCAEEVAAFETCYTENGCDQDYTGACYEDHCGAELEAADSCLQTCFEATESCGGQY